MKTSIKWQGKMAFEAISNSNHQILMDAPSKVGGDNKGASPMEIVLAALGGCTGMDVISILEKMRVNIEDFQIDIKSERSPEHPKVFSKLNIVYKFRGKNIPADKVKRAVELTQEKYCSVLHMVNKTAEISYSYEIIES